MLRLSLRGAVAEEDLRDKWAAKYARAHTTLVLKDVSVFRS